MRESRVLCRLNFSSYKNRLNAERDIDVYFIVLLKSQDFFVNKKILFDLSRIFYNIQILDDTTPLSLNGLVYGDGDQ